MSERTTGQDLAQSGGQRLSGTVTALEVQVRDQSRVNLYLDGRFAFGLSAKSVADAGLKRGDHLGPDRIADLLKGEAREQAMFQAFNYLSYRGRSTHEMQQYLRKKGHAPETIDSVVTRLVDLHYLDDTHFAVSWVENRRRAGGRGPHLLRSELLQKGVARDTAEQATEDAAGEQHETALEAARKKATGLRAADYVEFSRKLGGYLSRRGFSSEVVWETVKRVWKEREDGVAAEDDDVA
ncbi:MAG TPA: RecX family transcriptional regulator [Chloroflexota bacterium]|nr:RecX family transcriptional regulator [Chloroflexota bacterium]